MKNNVEECVLYTKVDLVLELENVHCFICGNIVKNHKLWGFYTKKNKNDSWVFKHLIPKNLDYKCLCDNCKSKLNFDTLKIKDRKTKKFFEIIKNYNNIIENEYNNMIKELKNLLI